MSFILEILFYICFILIILFLIKSFINVKSSTFNKASNLLVDFYLENTKIEHKNCVCSYCYDRHIFKIKENVNHTEKLNDNSEKLNHQQENNYNQNITTNCNNQLVSNRNICPYFIERKKQVSTKSYLCLNYTNSEMQSAKNTRYLNHINNQFNILTSTHPEQFLNQVCKNDLKGFCSAGVIPYYIDSKTNKIYILVAKETRNNETKYCFIGGKRDHIDEMPIHVSTREFKEETHQFLKCQEFFNIYNHIINIIDNKEINAKNPQLNSFYSASAKFILFAVKIPYSLINQQFYKKSLTLTENFDNNIAELNWLQLDKIVKSDFHSFSYNMLYQIQEMCINFNWFFY